MTGEVDTKTFLQNLAMARAAGRADIEVDFNRICHPNNPVPFGAHKVRIAYLYIVAVCVIGFVIRSGAEAVGRSPWWSRSSSASSIGQARGASLSSGQSGVSWRACFQMTTRGRRSGALVAFGCASKDQSQGRQPGSRPRTTGKTPTNDFAVSGLKADGNALDHAAKGESSEGDEAEAVESKAEETDRDA